MGFFTPQNPGIGGLDELTISEQLFIQNLVTLSYSDGDILYYNGGALQRLPKGTDGQYLKLASGLPSWSTVSGTGDVVGPASSTDNAITRFDSTTGKLLQNSNWTIDDNGLMSASISTEQGFSLITSLGAGSGNNLMYLETTNASWDRPILRINNAGTSGGATNIRLDGPAPQIEFVETDQIGTDGSGKFEVGVNGDIFYISGRNSTNTSFEDTVKVDRQVNGGGIRLYGSTSGYTKIKGPATGTSKILTLPDITGTLSTLAGTETLTNKTLTSPTLTTPILGTPSSGTLTNCTGLPVSGIVASTTTAIGVGSVELGHASDTTIARSSAGVISVEGVVIPSISSTNTLTNKRITKRVLALSAGSATPSINTDNYDVVHITAQSAAITSFTTNLTGTPVDGDTLRISITDNGTARALTWGSSFESSGLVLLPTTTVVSTRLDVGFFWNTETSKWRCVAVS